MKTTRRSIGTSIIALLLCFAMLLGTTFAWFTDLVVSGNNIVQSGSLDVEMYWSDKLLAADSNEWQNADGVPIFTYDKWEPGYTEVKYVKVKNAGNLALQWRLNIEAEGEVTELADVIDVYYVNPVSSTVTTLEGKTSAGVLSDVIASRKYTSGVLLPAGEVSSEYTVGETILAIAFHMDKDAGNEYQGKSIGDGFSVNLMATQWSFENDAFGDGYDNEPEWPNNVIVGGNSASANVNTDASNKVAGAVALNSADGKLAADIPAGVQLKDGVSKVTLSVSDVADAKANVTLSETEATLSIDVHIEGVAEDNDVVMSITIKELLPVGLNMGNHRFYHVEDGATVEMTLLADGATPVHNNYEYDPATGDVVLYLKSFSEVAAVADNENAWEGERDYSWYNNAVAPVAEGEPDYVIANADQLAALSAIVGGMDGQTQNSFDGKIIKLLADINLGDKESENNPDIIFYPIGYWNNEGTYERKPVEERITAVESGFYTFEGTFDGNGHTIENFYQNTWEMKGDHNWYDPIKEQYYRDGMGLFGKVYGGTVKNLTVKNFSSDGEIATTGVIAAYADGATFENIAIFDCNPRVYNIGNGGIVGCVGWYAKEENLKTTFTNITVDNSNKISALWGSYDVACGGIVGQYYPTSGQSSVNYPVNAGIDLTNCHVAAQMDVYNDVCGNYQYYAYRYAGMLIGSVRENLPADENGHIYPDMSDITVSGCTVHFDSWNDYYYCELVANSIASYTHDHQFSRLEQVKAVDVENMTVTSLKGVTTDIPTSGRYNYVVVNGEHATENATCYHFVDGKVHDHDDYNGDGKEDKETVGGNEMYVENNRHIYLPFSQLFTGYGWGVTSKGLTDFDGVSVTHRDSTELIDKFEKNEKLTGDFLYRVGNGNAFPIGKLFQAIDESLIADSGVHVSVRSLVEGVTMFGTFVNNADDWTQSTLHITGGTGPAELTIQDYNNCNEFTIIVEVVSAHNVTQYSELKNQNSVLLDDITMSSNGKFSLYDNKTLYGNGFMFDVTAGLDSDTEGGYVGGNGTIWLRNSTLDNVRIIGEVYTKYGGTVKAEYNFPTVLVLGDSVIANSYISNGSSPVRVGSGCNIEIINSTLEGGIFANLDIRGGTVKLKDVVTINQSDKDGNSISNDKKIVGLGIVVYTGSTVTIDIDGLTQYNCISENATFTGEAETLRNAIFGDDYTEYQFTSENVTWVNTGIISMVAEVGDDNISDINGYLGKKATIAVYEGYVYAPNALTSVATPSVYKSSAQYHIEPNYEFDYTSKNNVPPVSGSNYYCTYDETNGRYTISFDDGESFVWDANILNVTKDGKSLTFTVSVSEGATVNADNTITFDSDGDYVVTYTYTDAVNYRLNGDEIVTYSVEYTRTVKITVYEVADTSAKTGFAFGDNEFRTETANNLTYVMPNVNATVDSNTAGIGVTTVGGVNIYYPIVSMHKSGSSSWYNYFSVFEAVTVTDLNGTVYNTSTTELPSGLSVIGGFILDADGNISTAESANGTGIFNYSTGKEIKCATYSSYGLCYYPDSQFSKTGTSDRAEQTIVVKYRYTDSNGTPYYYYVGYWCEAHTKTSICVTPDTLVTLADGTQKRIDQVTYDDQILVWNFYTGCYDTAPVSLLVNHGEGEYEIIKLSFNDGTTFNIVGCHGLFEVSSNEFIDIDSNNVASMVGKTFLKRDGNDFAEVVLVDYEIVTETNGSYTILSSEYYNAVLNGMLTISPSYLAENLYEAFEVGENMTYDIEKMEKDIATYGLYTYDEFSEYVTYEQFVAWNIANMKIVVGKGYTTYEDIVFMLEEVAIPNT